MKITNAEFVTGIATKKLFPGEAPEIAVAGRSNVGKSSFINMLTNRKKLARSSSEPGRTRLLNYFSVNNGEFFLVDLPGYGYARVAEKERDSWKGLIEYYLRHSTHLRFVFLVVDVRLEASPLDLQLAEYFNYYGIPYVLVATKADKLSKSAQKQAIAKIAASYGLSPEEVLLTSSLTAQGRDDILRILFDRLA